MITITQLTTMKPEIAFDFKTAHFSLFKITARRYRNCLCKKKRLLMHDRTHRNGMEKFQTGLFLRVYLKPDKQLMGHMLWGGGCIIFSPFCLLLIFNNSDSS